MDQTVMQSILSSINKDTTKTDEEKLEMVKYINKLEEQQKNQIKFKKSTDHLQEKFDTLIKIVKFIEKNIVESSCKIYGSFVRQMFEKMFLSTYDSSGYGDSENHDVDMTLFKSKDEFELHKKEFYNLIDTFEVMSKLDYSADIKFGNFFVVRITESTIKLSNKHNQLESLRKKLIDYIILYNQHSDMQISETDAYLPSRRMMQDRVKIRKLEEKIRNNFNNIPHFNIILKNPKTNQYIIIDLFAYPIKDDSEYNTSGDIDVNTIYITRDGILSKSDFLTSIHSIMNRRGIMKINMKKIGEDLLHKTLTYEEKSRIYNQLVNFAGFRTKILSVGYDNIISDNQICDLSFENEKICEITKANPPYIVINLECSHSLSIMAFSGLVNIKSSTDTEFVSCPYCRNKLMPKFIDSKVSTSNVINIPDSSLISDIYNSNVSRRESISINIPQPTRNEIISNENFSTLLEHIGLKPYVDKE